ncbi:MAG: hypothetical protein D6736_03445 [Nitrospinota bacterium]|nr:MAG: hypothetical protein D6736_03445 [Nitrospinota bacterium]
MGLFEQPVPSTNDKERSSSPWSAAEEENRLEQLITQLPTLLRQAPPPSPELKQILRLLEERYLRHVPRSRPLEAALDAATYYGDNELAIDVIRKKYLAPEEKGPLHLWERVARAIASVEKDQAYWYEKFLSILLDFRFVPGGRVMHGAGREDARRRPTLSNCYVIPIEEDSLEGIYQCLAESAMVYRTGGGVGTDLSVLRPAGAPVNATIDKSPGATAFMNLFSESTNTVSQAGRRGALMLTLRVDHPDVERFIHIKNDPQRQKVQYANISVLLTHLFMEKVAAEHDPARQEEICFEVEDEEGNRHNIFVHPNEEVEYEGKVWRAEELYRYLHAVPSHDTSSQEKEETNV